VAPTPRLALLLVLFLATAVGVQLYAAVRAWRDDRRLRASPRPPHRLRACLAYLAIGYVALLLGAAAIRTFAMQAFKLPSGAMIPTLLVGDHIMVNKLDYGARLETTLGSGAVRRLFGLRRPEPGDVIVFVWPKDRSKDFVKRVVAVEGETIEVRDRHVLVDGKPRDDPHATWVDHGRVLGDPYGPSTVPPGHVFVMGDNRNQSYDSRFWGPVPVADVKGRVAEVYWSWDPSGGVRWGACRGPGRVSRSPRPTPPGTSRAPRRRDGFGTRERRWSPRGPDSGRTLGASVLHRAQLGSSHLCDILGVGIWDRADTG
jgi:signal peptidase I